MLLHILCRESGVFLRASTQGWYILDGHFLSVTTCSPGSVGTLSGACPVQPLGTPGQPWSVQVVWLGLACPGL